MSINKEVASNRRTSLIALSTTDDLGVLAGKNNFLGQNLFFVQIGNYKLGLC